MKLVISMLVPGMSFTGDSLNKQSLGGSETAGLCLARELAALGHRVYMFCNCPEVKDYDGVLYLPAEQYTSFITGVPHDVTIVQRMPEMLSGKVSAKLRYLWCHDLAQGRNAANFNGIMWNVDKVAVVSEWMKEQYKKVYGLPEEKLVVMRNGVDLQSITYNGITDRDRFQMIYTSRPERGLDVLLSKIFPRVLERVPQATLAIAGYDNQVEHLRGFYGHIQRLVEGFGDKVKWLGHLNKSDLYGHYERAGVYSYPTPAEMVNQEFVEVSCITAMECAATGLPFVSSARGALPETCGQDNTLVAGHPSEEGYVNAFVNEVVRLMTDDEYFLSKTIAAYKHLCTAEYTWPQIARDWGTEFLSQFEKSTSNPQTLVRHFINNSDIIAAQYVLSNIAYDKGLQSLLDEHWGFYRDKKAYKRQYDKIGETHTDCYEGAMKESRLQGIIQWLTGHPEIETLVDVGCGLGVYAIEISNALPNLKVTGIDISEDSIKWANKYVAERAKHPQNLEFITGDHNSIQLRRNYDCALAAEVVEHVPDPWNFIQTVENLVKTDGYVLLTVPYGPWEQMSYDSYPYRCHLWNFEYYDILDMVGKKPKLNVQSSFAGVNEGLAEPLGHNYITYKADHRTIGTVDLNRKTAIQNPKRTLSANIICGPNAEETLHWCLRSLTPVVNEIIIGDTGMSPEAHRIISEYKPTYSLERIIVVEVKSPLEIGFDAARNAVLEHSTMDWVLWIDTDEKLIEPVKLFKYLQSTGYNGFGIRQHHFAVDTDFNPDMPVRLFRRDADLRFYGRIHEHPELSINEGPGPVIVISDVHIAHVGYLVESGRKRRFWRNHPLLQRDKEDYPQRLLQKHFIIRDNLLLASYILQQTDGQVTHQVAELCEEAIALFREHFLGKAGYVNVDSLNYYGQALKILGRGIDCGYQFQASKAGVNESITKADARYENYDDMIKDVTWQLEHSVKRFDQEWF